MAGETLPNKTDLTGEVSQVATDVTAISAVSLGRKKSGRISLNRLPIDGLPASVIRYIEKVCEIYHCPRAFVTCSVLATAATATGKKIKINEGKYKNSLVLWFVFVARSGSNKSYPIKLISAPLRKIDAELYAAY